MTLRALPSQWVTAVTFHNAAQPPFHPPTGPSPSFSSPPTPEVALRLFARFVYQSQGQDGATRSASNASRSDTQTVHPYDCKAQGQISGALPAVILLTRDFLSMNLCKNAFSGFVTFECSRFWHRIGLGLRIVTRPPRVGLCSTAADSHCGTTEGGRRFRRRRRRCRCVAHGRYPARRWRQRYPRGIPLEEGREA